MNCFKKRRPTWVGGDKRSHVTLKCCWNKKVLLSTCVKASNKEGMLINHEPRQIFWEELLSLQLTRVLQEEIYCNLQIGIILHSIVIVLIYEPWCLEAKCLPHIDFHTPWKFCDNFTIFMFIISWRILQAKNVSIDMLSSLKLSRMCTQIALWPKKIKKHTSWDLEFQRKINISKHFYKTSQLKNHVKTKHMYT
jgi:hypothetical protein